MSRSQSKAEYGRFAHLVVGGLEWLLSQWQELTGGAETDLHNHAPSGGGPRLLDRHVSTGAETSWAQAFPETGSHAHVRITGVFAGADAAIYVAPDRGTGGGGGITIERTGALNFLLTADVLFFREASGCIRWQLNAEAMVPGGWDVGNALHSLGIFCLDDNDGVTPVALPAGTIIEWWVE